MSSVVQTVYRTRLAKATNGLVVDEGGYEVATRYRNGADIGFGLAVSDVAGEAHLGGDTFLGISVRDVTQNGAPLDPLSDSRFDTDVYGSKTNVALLTRGRAWVTPDTAVAAGNALYYDYVTGKLGASASGMSATGWVSFAGLPEPDETITFNGSAVTFKASGATGLQVNIRETVGETVTDLVTLLNATSDNNINDATYSAWPIEGESASKVMISHDTPGTGGNGYTLAESCAAATLSGANLTGGFGATAAAGDIVFHAQPASSSTMTFNGSVVTFGDGTGGTINRGASLAAAVDNAVTFLNGSGDAEIAKCTYSAAGTPHDTLHLVSDTTGQSMNSYTIAASSSPDSHGTPSGPTLSGGAPASVAVTNARWATSAPAGDLAIVSLGLQR